jgi:GMP synthase-like glutamine amidotransferase
VPHIGWNTLELPSHDRDPLLRRAPLEHVYYAHSYACRPDDEQVVRSWTTHDRDRFAAVVRRGSAFGVQFHPEKSSRAGVRFLHAYLESIAATRIAHNAGTPLATCADIDTGGVGAGTFAGRGYSGPGAMPCS